MKSALFTNFSSEEFTWGWDGSLKTFAPGQSMWMPDYLARHFAKHLVNRELQRKNANGDLIYPQGEKMTSPKRPKDFPVYMELFNKAFTPDPNETEELGDKKDDVDALINSSNRNRGANGVESPSSSHHPQKDQIVLPPDDGSEDDEDSFEGKPKE